MNDGGRIAYRGFEYQIRVSAWLVLELLLREQTSGVVAIEPPSGNDLDLYRRAPATHDTSGTRVGLRTPAYGIQVKGRGTGHWTPGELLEIVEGAPVATLRAHSNARYLFVTDGIVSPAIRSFVTQDLVFRHDVIERKDLSDGWSSVEDSVATRIGVIQKCTLETVHLRADRWLRERLRVPQLERSPCIEALVAMVRRAILHERDTEISLGAVEDIARRYGGCPSGPPVFVSPARFDEAETRLREKHVVLLVGIPGIGKSTAAERLAFEYRSAEEPYRVVRPNSPADLRVVMEGDAATVVVVDDPFGAYEETARGREWLGALAEFAHGARRDRKLIITSRGAFLRPLLDVDPKRPDASADAIRPHSIALGEDYDRQALLERHVAHAGPRAEWLLRAEYSPAIRRLARPISYSVLARRACETEVHDEATLTQLLSDAEIDGLGRELEKPLRDKPAEVLMGVAAVWIVLSREKVPTLAMLEGVEDDLRPIRAEVTSAAKLLERHGWLARDGVRLTIHPIYLQALRDALDNRSVLRAVVLEGALLAAAGRDQESVVLSMLDLSRGLVRLGRVARHELTPHFRRWLTTDRTGAGERPPAQRFADLLRAAVLGAAVGDPIQLLCAALATRTRRSRTWQLHFENWSLPGWSEELYARVASDPDVVTIVRRFVRFHLPGVPDLLNEGADALVGFLYRMGDVSTEFDALVSEIEDFAYFHTDIVALGAARSAQFDREALLARAMDLVSRAEAQFAEDNDADEDSYAYNEHISELYGERIKPAHALVDAVLAVSASDWVATRTESIAFERFAESLRYRPDVDGTVVRHALRACPTPQRRDIVRALFQHKGQLDLAVEALVMAAPSEWAGLVVDYALRTWREEEQEEHRVVTVSHALVSAVPALSSAQRVALLYDLRARRAPSGIVRPLLGMCTHSESDALGMLEGKSVNDEASASVILETVADEESGAAPAALTALASRGRPVDRWVTRWLDARASSTLALSAISVLTSSNPADANALRLALRHRSASVRKGALETIDLSVRDLETTLAVARLAVGPERDRTPSVRIAAARALSRDMSSIAGRALAGLLSDGADTSEAAREGRGWEDEDIEYGVAIAGARALWKRSTFDAPLVAALRAFLVSRAPTRRVWRIRRMAEALLRRAEPHASQGRRKAERAEGAADQRVVSVLRALGLPFQQQRRIRALLERGERRIAMTELSRACRGNFHMRMVVFALARAADSARA